MKTTTALRFNFRRSIAALIACVVVPAHAFAASVHGASDALVLWASAPNALPQTGAVEMLNRDRTFIPPYLVVPVGATVRFPNDDSFYHSIYSTSPADPFDIGYYGTGPGKTVTFSKTGIVDIHCHIHVSMHGTIVVVDGPYAYASKGAYALNGVPVGKHVLHAWDPTHGERTMTIDIPSENADVSADLR